MEIKYLNKYTDNILNDDLYSYEDIWSQLYMKSSYYRYGTWYNYYLSFIKGGLVFSSRSFFIKRLFVECTFKYF